MMFRGMRRIIYVSNAVYVFHKLGSYKLDLVFIFFPWLDLTNTSYYSW